MEVLAGLFFLGLAIFIFAAIGHGIWVLGAAFVRSLQPALPRCQECGRTYASHLRICPYCVDAPGARQRSGLRTAASILHDFIDDGDLDAALGQRILSALEESGARPEKLASVAERVHKLLSSRNALETFTPYEAGRLLHWLEQLDPWTAPLAPAMIWKSAQFLKLHHKHAAALEYYQRLFRDHRDEPFIKAAALQAAGYAQERGWTGHARTFLDVASSGDLSPQEARHATAMRADLDSVRPAVIELSSSDLVQPAEADRLSSPPTAAPAASPAAPAAVLAPRRTIGEMFAGFMEERNILWGELAGGLLIIGCSIALVISLWSTLENIPYFPFLVFAGLTGLVFGTGVYTLGHWKLEATSRGLLVIANLFVPLDFLVMAGLAKNSPWGLVDGILALLAIAGASCVVWISGRILLAPLADVEKPAGRAPPQMWFTLGVVGAGASQLVVARWLDFVEVRLGWFLACSLLSALFHCVASAGATWRLSRRPALDGASVNCFLLFLGQTTFAVVIALGFMVYASDQPLDAFRHLAIAVAASALPLVVGGAMIRLRLAADASDAGRGLRVGHARVLGTVLSLTGTFLILFALVLGWPRPLALLVIGSVNAIALIAVARTFRVPYVHIPGLINLLIAFLAAFHGIRGDWPADPDPAAHVVLALVFQPATGVGLTILAVLLAAASEVLARLSTRRTEAVIYLLAAAQCAFAAVALAAAPDDFSSPRAFGVLAVLSLTTLAVNLRWRRPELSMIASLMVAASIYFAARWQTSLASRPHLLLWTMAIHSTLFLIGSVILERRVSERWIQAFAKPFHDTGIASSGLALVALGVFTSPDTLTECAGFAGWFFVLWLAMALLRSSPHWFRAAVAMSIAAALYAASAWIVEQPWAHAPDDVAVTRSIQAILLALSGVGLAWMTVRRIGDGVAMIRPVLGTEVAPIDWVLTIAVMAAQGVLLVAAFVPPLFREMLVRANLADVPLDFGWAWTAWGLLAATLVIGLWQRCDKSVYASLTIAALLPALLFALHAVGDHAAGSTLRWSLAAIGLGGAALLWSRQRLATAAARVRMSGPADATLACRVILLVGATGPVLMLTTWVAILGFMGIEPMPPAAESFFGRIGWVASMTVPLLMVAATLFGHGVREDRVGYIFSTGLVLVYAVAGGYALSRILAGVVFDARLGIFTGQLAVIVAAGWMLFWLASGRWQVREWLATQGSLPVLGNMVLLASGLLTFGLHLGNELPQTSQQLGRLPGWLAWGLPVAAVLWAQSRFAPAGRVHGVSLAGVGAALLILWSAAPLDSTGWLSFHLALAFGVCFTAAMAGASWSGVQAWFPAEPARAWVRRFGIVMAAASLAGLWEDPLRPYAAALVLAGVAALFGFLAFWTRRPLDASLSGAMAPIVAYVICQSWIVDELQIRRLLVTHPRAIGWLLGLEVTALAGASFAASLLENVVRPKRPAMFVDKTMPFACASAYAGFFLWAIWVVFPMIVPLWQFPDLARPLTWAALLAVTASLLVLWWDADAFAWRLPDRQLFVFGILALFVGVEQFPMNFEEQAWWLSILVAGYLLALNILSRGRIHWAPLLTRLGMPPREPVAQTEWWVGYQTAVASTVLFVASAQLLFWTDVADRLGSFYVFAMATASSWLLTRGAIGTRWLEATVAKAPLPFLLAWAPTTLVLSLASLVVLGRAWIDATVPVPILHGSIWLLTVLLLGGVWFRTGLRGLVGPDSPWRTWARVLGRPVLALAGVTMAAVYFQEFLTYDAAPLVRTTPLLAPAKWLMTGLLFGLLAALLVAALSRITPRPADDPLRSRCVWFAEGVVVLLLIHLRLNVPDIFTGFLDRNWTLVLTAVGFAAVLAGEAARRRALPMLAGPLHITGLVLPLVPLAALVLRPVLLSLSVFGETMPGVDPILRYFRPERLPDSYWLHASLWFWYGTLWTVVAVLRRSPLAGLVAALACNFGFWVVLGNQELLTFVLHPQLWLIPLGLIVLAAEAIHRRQLTPAQAAAFRYLGLMLIFVSSAADLFIAGLGNSFVLPIVLALMSVLAIFAGIFFRVQAFLFTGMAFLTLTVLTQIWHAAHNLHHTWIWWACGIVLGAAIFALFAIFEKRRGDVLRVVDEIRRWG